MDHDRTDPALLPGLAEGFGLGGGDRRGAPAIGVLAEDLHGAGTDADGPLESAVQAAGHRHVGPEQTLHDAASSSCRAAPRARTSGRCKST